MRVDLNGTATSQVDTAQKTSQTAGKRSNLVRTEDKATLSVDTTAISSLSSQALNMPEVRQDKVDALRQAVNDGTYQVDPSKIADSILNENTK